MIRSFFDQLTGRTFLRNARARLEDISDEIIAVRLQLLSLEITPQSEATLKETRRKLWELECHWTMLDNWFTDYGHARK